MGLIKKNGYNVKGIELETAYAKINRLYIERGNMAVTYFGISNSRENINNGNSLEEIRFECSIDKNEPIYEQIYVNSKLNIFSGWEDDIVVEEPVVEEDTPKTLPTEQPVDITIPEKEEKDDNISTMPVEEKVDVTIEEPTMPERGVW